jgi:hypothetical protein
MQDVWVLWLCQGTSFFFFFFSWHCKGTVSFINSFTTQHPNMALKGKAQAEDAEARALVRNDFIVCVQ